MIKDYYELTKSGLVFGNIITVIAGFALGAEGHFNLVALFAAIVGIALVMASGCVFNNYIDRDIDAKMERTRGRALVTRRVSGRAAIIFGTILGIAGFAVLILFNNLLTALVALLGFVFYVLMYSLWWKRYAPAGTVIGAIAGATPPVVGYCAATNRLDVAALILFLILVTWQMPHFFAIAIRREEDYAAAHIPVTPVVYGVDRTKSSMLIYIVEFALAASLLFVFGYEGYVYLAIVGVLVLVWVVMCARGFWISGKEQNKKWALGMFFVSLIILVVTSATIIGASLIPNTPVFTAQKGTIDNLIGY